MDNYHFKLNGIQVDILEYSNKGIIIFLEYNNNSYRLIIRFGGQNQNELEFEFRKEE